MALSRVVIVDRSILALNIYELILKSLNLSIVAFQNLQELKKGWPLKFEVTSLLINTNVLNEFSVMNIQWFREETSIAKLPKVFLIKEDQKNSLKQLDEISLSSYLIRPFFPKDLAKIFQERVQ